MKQDFEWWVRLWLADSYAPLARQSSQRFQSEGHCFNTCRANCSPSFEMQIINQITPYASTGANEACTLVGKR